MIDTFQTAYQQKVIIEIPMKSEKHLLHQVVNVTDHTGQKYIFQYKFGRHELNDNIHVMVNSSKTFTIHYSMIAEKSGAYEIKFKDAVYQFNLAVSRNQGTANFGHQLEPNQPGKVNFMIRSDQFITSSFQAVISHNGKSERIELMQGNKILKRADKHFGNVNIMQCPSSDFTLNIIYNEAGEWKNVESIIKPIMKEKIDSEIAEKMMPFLNLPSGKVYGTRFTNLKQGLSVDIGVHMPGVIAYALQRPLTDEKQLKFAQRLNPSDGLFNVKLNEGKNFFAFVHEAEIRIVRPITLICR